jgi:hypothetical protein
LSMKDMSQTNKRALLVTTTLLAASFSGLADTIDWDGGNWNGGTANGYTSGSPTGTTTGGAVTVNWALFGTADGTHSALPSPPGIQPQVLTSVGVGGAGNGVLTLGTSNDRNPGGLANYTTLTLNFSTLVSLANGALTIQDVDFNSTISWQDFIAVQAFNGASSVGVTYTTTAANGTVSHKGLNGVQGLSNVPNSGVSQANANVGVNFAGDLDMIVIYLFQGPAVVSGVGTDHAVWLKDIEYTPAASPVPEPSTITMGLAGTVLCLLASRLRKR